MRIGVNALYLIPGRVGGTEIYLRSLLKALGELDGANRYSIFVNRETGADLAPAKPNFQVIRTGVAASFRPARILHEQIALPIRSSGKLDVLLNPGFTAPFVSGCPNVTVFHDLQHKRHPEHFRWFDLPFWRMLLHGSAHRSSHLIAVSESTKADLLYYYGLDPARVHVVHHGVESAFFDIAKRRENGGRDKYFLSVSTLHPHKNLDRLVRNFSAFRREQPEFKLVIAGMRGFFSKALEQTIDACGARDGVELTGWIPRPDLHKLYERAWAFVYPSTFEGFGMPVLEALAAGVPTACSAIPPLHEVAGDTALQFSPYDDTEMLDALRRIATDDDLRNSLIRRGRERASHYSWRRTAEETLSVLKLAAG